MKRAAVKPDESLVVLAETMPGYQGIGSREGTRVIDLGNILANKYVAPALVHQAAARTRDFCEKHWWIRRVLTLKLGFFFTGFRVVGDAKMQEWLGKNMRMRTLSRFAGDLAREFCSMDNAAVTWTDWAPQPWRQNIESIREYKVWQGRRSMTICIPGSGPLTKEQNAVVPKHWADKWQAGGDVKLDEELGDHFAVVTDGFTDAGLVQPGVMTALALFCTLEFLNRADWTASFQHGNIIRQMKKGFLLPAQLASATGQVEKKMSKVERDKLKREAAKKTGGQDWVTQHDLEIAFKYLEPEFFNPQKYEGVMKHLRVWAGSVAELQDDKPSQYVLTQMRAEAALVREKVADIIETAANESPLLDKRQRPRGDIRVAWDDTKLWDGSMLLERWRMLCGQGAMSQTTLRMEAGLDNATEGDRLEAELADPDRYRPSFEPKQGMLTDKTGGNGRPIEKSNDAKNTQ